MKVKKLAKVLPPYEVVRIWGKDEETPLYYGEVIKIPSHVAAMVIKTDDPLAYGVEIRYNNSDIEDHIAIQVIDN